MQIYRESKFYTVGHVIFYKCTECEIFFLQLESRRWTCNNSIDWRFHTMIWRRRFASLYSSLTFETIYVLWRLFYITQEYNLVQTSMKTYIVKLVVCTYVYIYISLKSQNHTESSILRKEKFFTHNIAKNIYVFFVIIVNWMIIFDKGSIEYLEINSLSPGGCSLNFMCVMFQMCCGDYFPEHF